MGPILKTAYTRAVSLLVSTILIGWCLAPAQAQADLKLILQNTPQTRLKFAPYTVGAVIAGGGNRVYVLNAQKGQTLQITGHSFGMRAMLVIFAPNGQRLKTIGGASGEQTWDYELKQSGDYYLFCYSGPTVHLYDFTVRIE